MMLMLRFHLTSRTPILSLHFLLAFGGLLTLATSNTKLLNIVANISEQASTFGGFLCLFVPFGAFTAGEPVGLGQHLNRIVYRVQC